MYSVCACTAMYSVTVCVHVQHVHVQCVRIMYIVYAYTVHIQCVRMYFAMCLANDYYYKLLY